MNEIVEELKKWREARNMQDNEFVVEEQVAYMLDECKEILLAKTDEHKAEEYCDVAILAFNGLGLLSADFRLMCCYGGVEWILEFLATTLREFNDGLDIDDLLSEVVSICKIEVESLGYNFQKMMLEKIKVISSREQDPEQAKEWALNGASGKWEKNKAQSKDTLYKPDFESCRLGG